MKNKLDKKPKINTEEKLAREITSKLTELKQISGDGYKDLNTFSKDYLMAQILKRDHELQRKEYDSEHARDHSLHQNRRIERLIARIDEYQAREPREKLNEKLRTISLIADPLFYTIIAILLWVKL